MVNPFYIKNNKYIAREKQSKKFEFSQRLTYIKFYKQRIKNKFPKP